jgi:hypothetical protein
MALIVTLPLCSCPSFATGIVQSAVRPHVIKKSGSRGGPLSKPLGSSDRYEVSITDTANIAVCATVARGTRGARKGCKGIRRMRKRPRKAGESPKFQILESRFGSSYGRSCRPRWAAQPASSNLAEDQKIGVALFARSLGVIARVGESGPGIAPVVGTLRRPREIPRTR